MNNKEFISELSCRFVYTNKDTTQLVSSVISIMAQQLQDGNTVAIQGFGTFEVRKKLERISINPATQQRMLIPPKLVLTYKPSAILKEFISELSCRFVYTNKDTTQLVSSVISIMAQQLQDGNTVAIQGFGTFEVRKKLERISINPATQQRMLIPPKLVLTYKPSAILKEKFK